jgi:hypothetical protein
MRFGLCGVFVNGDLFTAGGAFFHNPALTGFVKVRPVKYNPSGFHVVP